MNEVESASEVPEIDSNGWFWLAVSESIAGRAIMALVSLDECGVTDVAAMALVSLDGCGVTGVAVMALVSLGECGETGVAVIALVSLKE